MQTSARPLLDNPVDADLFVGRATELVAACSGLNAGLNILVTGDRGVGRTSFLRNLQFTTRTAPSPLVGDFPMTYVRVEGVTSGIDLLQRIVQTVTGNEPPFDEVELLMITLADHRKRFIDETYQRWLAEDEGDIGSDGTRLLPVIIVDDVTAAAGHELFGRYRDEVWATGYLWIVSVRESERGGLMTPPADTFFEKIVELGPLSREESVELINRRAEGDLGAIGRTLTGAVSRNPRALVSALRDLLEDPQSFEANSKAIGLRDAAIHALGRPASMLAAELEARGAVSASDEGLLSALGWTRPRAVQVFKELSANYLVTSRDVPTGQGRPRRIYELAAPAEWLRQWEQAEDRG